MKKSAYLTILLLFTTCLSILAQRPQGRGGYQKAPSIKGKVTGSLVDSTTNEPIAFVSVALRNPKADKIITGTMTGEDGTFKLQDVPVGSYELIVAFVGYKKKTIPITTTLKKPDVSIGNFSLESDNLQLDEVTIEGEREVIENRIDKIVYNADQDVANIGGDGADVLRRAPLLSVDLEGNVSLRGSSNIQILVNGKPSSIFASNPADALRAIPADQIKSVEVITTPSAKYDGEGSAGIINIITKKKSVEGIAGSVNASLGNRSNRGSLNLNGGRGRFGFNATGSTYFSWPLVGPRSFYREDLVQGQLRTLTENGDQETQRIGFFANAGAYYDFNAFHSLNTSFRLRGFSSDRDGSFFAEFNDPIQDIFQNYQRTSDNSQLVSGYEWSLDYTMKFPEQEERELAFAYKIDGDVSDQEFQIGQEDLLANDLSLFRDERNFNDGNNQENTIQIDYTHPISKKFKVETGAKSVLRAVNSQFSYDEFNTNTNQYETDNARTDDFDYDQDVIAGYLSSNVKFGEKWGLVAGARYETTRIAGRFANQETTFENDYGNLLPSVILSYKLGKASTTKASYTRRIQRPSLRFINPFVQIANNRDISQGNPELDPELTDQYELSFNTFVKRISINASVYFRQTTGIIESILNVNDEGVSVTTFQNVGTGNSIGFNFFSSATLFKIWTLRGGFNLFTYDATGTINGQELSREALLFNGNINSSIKVSDSWTIDMFGFYRAPRQTLQGFNPSFTIFSMGIQKKIWKDRGALGIRIVEPFFEFKEFASELRGENYFQSSEFNIPFRSFGINFSYKFGKLDFKQRRRSSKIRNTDLKEGGGNEGSQF